MYLITDDSYNNKTLDDIIVEMPNSSEYYMPYIKCANKEAIQKLGFSQYSTMRISKVDQWNITIVIIGMKGHPVGFWLGNKNSNDIVSEIRVI